MVSLLILSGIYGILGLMYLFPTIQSIVREGEVRLIHGVKLMYAFVYGILPMLVYFKESTGERNLAYYDYSPEGIFSLYMICLFSFAGFFLLSVFYQHFYNRNRVDCQIDEDITIKNEYQRENNYVFVCGVIALIIGWIGLILWTKAYGSLGNFILNASSIRSGRGGVQNSLAFMKQFAKIMPVSMYALLAALLVNRPKGLRKIIYIFLFVNAVIGSYVYLLASDSRVTIALSGIAVYLIVIKHRKNTNMKRSLITGLAVVVLLLILTMSADTITRYARYGIWISANRSFTDSIITEFSYIQTTQNYIFDHCFSGGITLKLTDDLIGALTAWIPERFIPFSLPATVWAYNTLNIAGTSASGTIPSDLLSTGMYHLGILGIFTMPVFVGWLTAFADKKIKKHCDVYYTDAYFGTLFGIYLRLVTHNQLSSFVSSLFPLFLFYLIGYFVRSTGLSNGRWRMDSDNAQNTGA